MRNELPEGQCSRKKINANLRNQREKLLAQIAQIFAEAAIVTRLLSRADHWPEQLISANLRNQREKLLTQIAQIFAEAAIVTRLLSRAVTNA